MADDEVFEDRSLTGAVFRHVDLSGARLDDVDLRGVVVRRAVVDLTLEGWIQGLHVNGVDVLPLLEAELDRRDPDRVVMRPVDPAGFRAAADLLELRWAETVARARGLEPSLLHERVDGEWSFVQTLRHLVFATDAWHRRAVRGEPTPWHPLDLPHDEMPDIDGVPRDPDARPDLDQVLVLRADRWATFRAELDGLTDEQLVAQTEPVLSPGYPESESFPVAGCLRTVLDEEWEHRRYAERDLAVLAARPG